MRSTSYNPTPFPYYIYKIFPIFHININPLFCPIRGKSQWVLDPMGSFLVIHSFCAFDWVVAFLGYVGTMTASLGFAPSFFSSHSI